MSSRTIRSQSDFDSLPRSAGAYGLSVRRVWHWKTDRAQAGLGFWTMLASV